jgi:hypothetical protein
LAGANRRAAAGAAPAPRKSIPLSRIALIVVALAALIVLGRQAGRYERASVAVSRHRWPEHGRQIEGLQQHGLQGVRIPLRRIGRADGEENGLRVRIFGTKAGLDCKQENPNYLDLLYSNEPARVYKRGNDYLDPIVKHNSRLPFGHPEGFIEAFANIYAELAQASGANFGAGSIAPDAATTDRGTIKENSNCGMLNVADEVIAGAGTEPARSWVDTWTESGGGHRSVLMRTDLAGIPEGANVLAARLVVTRAGAADCSSRSKLSSVWIGRGSYLGIGTCVATCLKPTREQQTNNHSPAPCQPSQINHLRNLSLLSVFLFNIQSALFF